MTTVGELMDKVVDIDETITMLRNRGGLDNIAIAEMLEDYRDMIVRIKVNL